MIMVTHLPWQPISYQNLAKIKERVLFSYCYGSQGTKTASNLLVVLFEFFSKK